MKDPVSDLLIRIKNALQRKKELVDIPSSMFKENIAKVLADEGFVNKYEVLTRGGKKVLRISLKYAPDRFGKLDKPAITEIAQVSKPGKRVYSEYGKILPVNSGFGISVMSTPSGVMTGEEARRKKVGGEVVLKVF